jgi:hypothetical protein
MQPIRAIPSSDAPSDQTGGTPAQTAQRSYGSAPPHCASSRPPAARCRVWALATEHLPGVLVPESGHCRKPHQPARAARREDQGRERETLPGAAAPPRLAARLPFDSHRSRLLLSPRLPPAGLARPRLSATPCRICPEPRGWGPSARPFFCGLLGALQQDLLPVEPWQGCIALGHLLPRPAKSRLVQPHLEPALDCLVRGKPLRQHAPPNPRHQDVEHGVQTLPVVVGRSPVALVTT